MDDIIFDIERNINSKFVLRDYQREAIFKLNEGLDNGKHFAFQMATGSGKTLVMACNILQLARLGYSKFIFLVNSENIITKTRFNFLETYSGKYLFNNRGISFNGDKYIIREVDNFEFNEDKRQDSIKYINIAFMTIQKLHSLISIRRENSIDLESLTRNKIAILSDEAHHINSSTKKSKGIKSKKFLEEKTWENTVLKILSLREENVLLEYTATMGLDDIALNEKYRDKLIFSYDFHRFRRDGYSKEVKVLQSDFDKKNRILSSLLVSEYKKFIAEDNGIALKPVILIKSKNIKECDDDVAFFNRLIKELTSKDIVKLESFILTDEANTKVDIDNDIICESIKYFKEKFNGYSRLIELFKCVFSDDVIEVVHSKIDKNSRSGVLERVNDLENNNVRIIFSVDMLNEGWDVLNLFDIVRLDESDGKKKDVIKDVQLIGRGARYYPIKLHGNKYRRKFDNDVKHPLKSIEELHYHSYYNPKYLTELREISEKLGIVKSKDEIGYENINSKSELENNRVSKQKVTESKNLSEVLKNFSFRYVVGNSFHNEEAVFDYDDSYNVENSIKSKYKYSYKCSLDRLDGAEFNYPIFRHCFNSDILLNLRILKSRFDIKSYNEFVNIINSSCKIKIYSIDDLKELNAEKVPLFKTDIVKLFCERLSVYLSRFLY